MMLPVIKRVVASGAQVLLTTQTVSAAEAMATQLPEGARHQFMPIDTPKAVKAFLEYWRPDAALFAESELWPNLLREVKARGIPAALVNARMNAKSLQGWGKRKRAFVTLLSSFEIILPADRATREGIEKLTGRVLPEAKTLKMAASLDVPDAEKLVDLKSRLEGARALCVLSAHPEEVPILEKMLAALPESVSMVVVPRYPDRMEEYDEFDGRQAIVLPGFGTTALACAVSEFAVMGGSLDPSLKGHNPMEPLSVGLPVASGVHVASFADIYADWFAAIGVQANESIDCIAQWLSDADALEMAQDVAKAFAKGRAGVIDEVMDALAPILEPNV